MKILLLNAGANNHGATQEILAILRDALSCDTELVCLGDLNIGYCKGCKVCYDTCKCVQTDEMEPLLDRIDSADRIVIAAPSYWADVPGQFKVFIDRCTAYSDTNQNPNHRTLKGSKKCYAIALRTGTRPVECEHIIETVKHWCGHMKINMVDSLYFCEINDKYDIEPYKAEICAKAKLWFTE